MTDRAAAARDILSIPLFSELMSDLEQAAINSCLNAPYDDHESRQAFAAEARAVRRLRQKIEVLAKEDQSDQKRKQAPA